MKKDEFLEAIHELAVCFGVEENEEQLKYWYEKKLHKIDIKKFKVIIPRIIEEEDRFPSLKCILGYLKDEFSDRFHSNYYEEKQERDLTPRDVEPISDEVKKKIEATRRKMGLRPDEN